LSLPALKPDETQQPSSIEIPKEKCFHLKIHNFWDILINY